MNGGTFNNLTYVIIHSPTIFCGMLKTNITNKVVYFGVDSVTIFQGLKIGVAVQLVSKHYLFVVGIHYMAHLCNLVIQTLSTLTFVAKIESLFSSMYTYYNQSPKRHLECTKLAKVIESRGLKILRNIWTQWISMLAFSKRLVFEYKYVIMKMSEDLPTNHVATTNYELLCDVETIMGLTCVLPMLEVV